MNSAALKIRAGRWVDVGVGFHQLGERICLELGIEVHARGALEIIEPVTVLQLLQLVLEHEVEGRAQQAAERRDLLGQAADPEIDAVKTRDRHIVRGAGMAVRAQLFAQAPVLLRKSSRSVGASIVTPSASVTADPVRWQGRAARWPSSVVAAGDQMMRAIGGNEVDKRLGVLDVLHKVSPADVGLEVRVADVGIEFACAPHSRRECRCRGRARC